MSTLQAPSSITFGGVYDPSGGGLAPNVPAAETWNPQKYYASLPSTTVAAGAAAPDTIASAGGLVPYVKKHMLPILLVAVGLYLLEKRRRGLLPV